MSNTEAAQRSPSRGSHHIGVPFASEAHYQECMAEVTTYRRYLTEVAQQHPALFPQAWGQGDTFHDCYRSRKQEVTLRRIKLKATGAVFHCAALVSVALWDGADRRSRKALYLRQWGGAV